MTPIHAPMRKGWSFSPCWGRRRGDPSFLLLLLLLLLLLCLGGDASNDKAGEGTVGSTLAGEGTVGSTLDAS